jgi:hypothetical protein
MPHHFSHKWAAYEAPRRKPAKVGPSAGAARRADPFLRLGLDPVAEAGNSALLSRFVTEMGVMAEGAVQESTRLAPQVSGSLLYMPIRADVFDRPSRTASVRADSYDSSEGQSVCNFHSGRTAYTRSF